MLLFDIVELLHLSNLIILTRDRLVLALNIFPDDFEFFVYLLHISIMVKTLVEGILELVLHVDTFLLGIQK